MLQQLAQKYTIQLAQDKGKFAYQLKTYETDVDVGMAGILIVVLKCFWVWKNILSWVMISVFGASIAKTREGFHHY